MPRQLTIEEHQELLIYFEEWLRIWNNRFIPEPWMYPFGNEPNFLQAHQVSNLLSDELMNIPI